MSFELVMPSNHLCHPLFLPSVFPSISIFPNKLALHITWAKYWSFSISPSNEYSGLISFRIDWFDLLTVQGTLKSLLQYHSSKASVLWHSAFFMAQLSHLYMITGKTIALTRWTFVGKLMSLLFNMLPRFAMAFLPRSRGLLILKTDDTWIGSWTIGRNLTSRKCWSLREVHVPERRVSAFGRHRPNKTQWGAGQFPSSGPKERGQRGRGPWAAWGRVTLQEQTKKQIQAEGRQAFLCDLVLRHQLGSHRRSAACGISSESLLIALRV